MAADYIYYTTTYGGTLSQDDYIAEVWKAEEYVRQMTMGKSDGNLPERVRNSVDMAICALVDIFHKDAKAVKTAGIDSETNDGISVKYRTRSQADADAEKRNAVNRYLAWTGLLYRGLGGGCCRC